MILRTAVLVWYSSMAPFPKTLAYTLAVLCCPYHLRERAGCAVMRGLERKRENLLLTSAFRSLERNVKCDLALSRIAKCPHLQRTSLVHLPPTLPCLDRCPCNSRSRALSPINNRVSCEFISITVGMRSNCWYFYGFPLPCPSALVAQRAVMKNLKPRLWLSPPA